MRGRVVGQAAIAGGDAALPRRRRHGVGMAVTGVLFTWACQAPHPAPTGGTGGTEPDDHALTTATSAEPGRDATCNTACRAGDLGCPCRSELCDAGACIGGWCVAVTSGDAGEMVEVPAGSFCMGCRPDLDPDCVSDELPVHEVQLDRFWIDRYEVTAAQYARCREVSACDPLLGDTVCRRPSVPDDEAPSLPVTCVNWESAAKYCRMVGKTLPTEAQWEKAARGSGLGPYPWGASPPSCEVANFEDAACPRRPWPPSPRLPGMSPYGAFDLAGNVWEWTSDWYSPQAYAADAEVGRVLEPKGAMEGSARTVRGGSFTSHPRFLRSTARNGATAPFVGSPNLGFRCVTSRLPAP